MVQLVMDWYIESRAIEAINFIGYTNSDLVGCMDDRKSTLGQEIHFRLYI